jgi:hypothetical protein
MRKKALSILLLGLMISLPLNENVNGNTSSLFTDKKFYQVTETVIITGETEPLSNITLVVTGSSGEIFNSTLLTDVNGTFTAIFELANDTLPGEYEVYMSNGEDATTNFTVLSINVQDIFNSLLAIAEYSKEKLEELMNETFEAGETPQQVEEQYLHGLEALLDAENLQEEALYTPAINAIHRAIQHFKNALHHIYSQTGRSLPEANEKILNQNNLEEKINNKYNELEKLNATLQQLITEEIDVGDAEQLLEEALESLNNASNALEEHDYEKAENEYEAAEELIDAVRDLVDEMAEEIKPSLALKFQKNFRNRIKQITKTLNKFSNSLSENKIRKAYKALEKADKNLEKIEEKITLPDNSNVFSELENITLEFKHDLENINGEELGNSIVNLNAIHANIQSLNQTHEKSQFKGIGSQGLQQQISKCEKVLEAFLKKVEEGKNLEANEIYSEYKKKEKSKTLGSLDKKADTSGVTGVKGK